MERQSKERECQEKGQSVTSRRLSWFGHVQRMENASRARQAIHWISAGKRKTKDYMERHSNEAHQPDECDVMECAKQQ